MASGSRRLPPFLLAPFRLALCLGGCHARNDAALAARGETDPAAPLAVHLHQTIAAPPARVWHALSGIAHWPDWQPDIHAVRIAGAVSPGTRFAWTVDGGTIRSRIAVLDPGRRLGWTGRLFWFHAIHIWTLSAAPAGGTVASCDESLAGTLVGWFMTPGDLAETDRRWLRALVDATDGPADRGAVSGTGREHG